MKNPVKGPMGTKLESNDTFLIKTQLHGGNYVAGFSCL